MSEKWHVEISVNFVIEVVLNVFTENSYKPNADSFLFC